MDLDAHTASTIIALGAVFFAIAVTLWAINLTRGIRSANHLWHKRARDLEEKISQADSIFSAHPGLVIIWDDLTADPDKEAGDWGAPRVQGSPVALGSLLTYTEGSDKPLAAAAILDGLADFEARDVAGNETTLRQCLFELRKNGEPFSLTISGTGGRFFEADGRAAGAQLVMWLTDSTIKGLEESSARGRLEEVRHLVSNDPVAFVDMLDKSPLPAWRLSSGLKLEWANRAYRDAVEAKTLESVLKKQVLLDPEGKTVAQKAQKENGISHVSAVIVGGARRFLEFHYFPVSGGLGALAVDVTDARSLDEKLSTQNRAHDETLNHLAEAVVIFSADQKMIFHNTAFHTLFDLEKSWLDYGPTHGEWLDHMRERRRIPEQVEYQKWKQNELGRYLSLTDADGSVDEKWPLPDGRTLRVSCLRHPFGGLLYIFDNITDQIDMQARFTTQVNVQRETLNNLTDAVAVFGSDGGLRLHNAAFMNLWSLRPLDLAPGEPLDVIAGKCLPLYADEDYWQALKARVTDPGPQARRQVSGEFVRKDDVILTWLSRPLPDGATVIAWSDVTASRTLQEKLQETAEASRAVAELKSRFVDHVSYQLRTPLTTIYGYAEMMEAGLAGPLGEKQKGPVEAIRSAASDLTVKFENILDIAAVDAGKLVLDLEDVNLHEILDAVAGLTQTRAEETQINLIIECPEDIALVRADGRRLKQVLYNLVLNALAHTHSSGSIILGASSDEAGVQFWVHDDGVGIDEKHKGRVFDDFESGKGGGAGLGLALVRSLINMHGGLVTFESEAGKGTKVTCFLPFDAKRDNAPPELDLTPKSDSTPQSVH